MFHILTLAFLEVMVDSKSKFEIGIPIFGGSFGMVLGVDFSAASISIALGIIVGVLSIVEKSISVYKKIKDIKKDEKETE